MVLYSSSRHLYQTENTQVNGENFGTGKHLNLTVRGPGEKRSSIAPVMRHEMKRVHGLMFISFLNLSSIDTVRTKIEARL